MKKPFIHKDFLLQSDSAKELYHHYAAHHPIIDYHCHLPPQEIADDINFRNLTHIWLDGDHYKWRALRACGVDERFITGDASDKEKFLKWAETVPKTIKNPLYHWTHMELKNPFGFTDLLNSDTAEMIWEECNEMLQEPDFSTRGLIKQNKVRVVATTDDPTDTLEHHRKMKSEADVGFKMVPTFRPDRGMQIENDSEFIKWVEKLGEAADQSISTFQDFLDALKSRHDLFDELGCQASDHGANEPFSDPFTDHEVENIFSKAMSGNSVTETESRMFKSAFLYYCGLMDQEKDWVFQLHVGALRNNSSRKMRNLGPDTGFDSIGDFEMARPLSRLLDRLDAVDKLPRVVLYNNNPRDNELFATMIGNFQDGTITGKLQHGPPWWFMDQKDGIERQVESLSNMGVLSEFIGMTTDSRSFLSYSRHDYFRRVICNILGDDMEKGLIPSDMELIGGIVEKICYQNAADFFRFD